MAKSGWAGEWVVDFELVRVSVSILIPVPLTVPIVHTCYLSLLSSALSSRASLLETGLVYGGDLDLDAFSNRHQTRIAHAVGEAQVSGLMKALWLRPKHRFATSATVDQF